MNDLELARSIRHWLSRPVVDADVLTASVNGRLYAEVFRVFPDARAVLGEAVVRAATRRVSGGGCPVCMARAYATVHNLPQPSFGKATQVLLGQPCQSCLLAARA